MAVWGCTKRGDVIKVPPSYKGETYVGTYEQALKWFGVTAGKSWGDLMNVVVYHQTDPRTFPKLSSELFDILVRAQSEHKYWTEPSMRESVAIATIEKAEKVGLVQDERLLEVLKKSDRKASVDRVRAHEHWLKLL